MIDAITIFNLIIFAGVFSSSLQLSDQPPLGPWTITVIAKVTTSFAWLHTLTILHP